MATKLFKAATQDAQGRYWATKYDPDSGETTQIQVMPQESDDGTMYRPATELEMMAPGANGQWNPTDLQKMVDLGGSVPVGATFAAPTSAQELASWGFAGGGAGPDPMIGLPEWLTKNNMSLQDFQTQTGGLPLVFNDDGTATYDPSAQKQSFSYLNPDDGAFHKVAPLIFAAMTGAGLAGLGAGGAAAAEGVAAGGAMDMGVGLGGSLGSWGGITPIAEGVGAGIGTGAGTFESIMDLGNFTNNLQIPTEGFNFADTFNPILESGSVNPINTNLGAGGFNSIDQMISSLASGGEATLGTVGAGGAIGAALGSAPTEGVGSLLERILGNGGSTAASAVSNLVKQLTGKDVSSGTLDLIGKGLGLGLGVYGANKQADATENLYNRFFDLGAPYRASLASLEANPQGFYDSPMVKGALQQGSDTLARSLSAKVGNPILNPTALQEMQNFTTRGLLDAYNQRFSQLSSAGQLGVGQSASLGTQAAGAQSGIYDALGAGARSVFGNQRDYAGELLDLMKSRPSSNRFGLP